jgi:hypothetical protein
MQKKYFLVASFEASEEEQARQIEREVADLLQKQVKAQRVSDGDVGLRGAVADTQRAVGTSETSSMPLDCDDIFEIEPDTL